MILFDPWNRIPYIGISLTKINSRSSTEAELIGVDDAIRFVECANLYYKELVKKYPSNHLFKDLIKKNLVKQDNTSTIKMMKGGRKVYG